MLENLLRNANKFETDAIKFQATFNNLNNAFVSTFIANKIIGENNLAITKEIIEDIDTNFSKIILSKFAFFVKPFIVANVEWLASQNTNLPFVFMLESDTEIRKYNKLKLLYSSCIIFSKPEIFRKFFDFLEGDIRKIFGFLIWNKSLKLEEYYSITGIAPHTGNYRISERITLENLIPYLSIRNSYSSNQAIYLPKNIQKLCRSAVDSPANFNLNTINEEDIPKNLFYWTDGENTIFEEIQKLVAYQIQGGILSNVSGKINKGAGKKMHKKLALKEFFNKSDDPNILYLRSNLLAQLVSGLDVSKKNMLSIDSLGLIEQLIKVFKKNYLSLNALNHLKGQSYMDHTNHQFEEDMIELINFMPLKAWVPVRNILDFLKLRNLAYDDIYSSYNIQYLTYEEQGFYSYQERVNSSTSEVYVYRPLIRSTLYLFASIGFFDIIYNYSSTSDNSANFISSFDSIQYVRLTSLGEFVFGISQDYTPKLNTHTQELVFDDNSLLIFCDPENRVAESILANYAVRVSPSRFKVDQEVFLKECRTEKQLKSKIDLFKKTIAPNLPANWGAFFTELQNKVGLFRLEMDYHVFSISETQKDLLKILAQDPELKAICIKAEGFKVLVHTKNTSKFKSRLRYFGYLLD